MCARRSKTCPTRLKVKETSSRVVRARTQRVTNCPLRMTPKHSITDLRAPYKKKKKGPYFLLHPSSQDFGEGEPGGLSLYFHFFEESLFRLFILVFLFSCSSISVSLAFAGGNLIILGTSLRSDSDFRFWQHILWIAIAMAQSHLFFGEKEDFQGYLFLRKVSSGSASCVECFSLFSIQSGLFRDCFLFHLPISLGADKFVQPPPLSPAFPRFSFFSCFSHLFTTFREHVEQAVAAHRNLHNAPP